MQCCLQSEGLIKHVGLSEVTPSELRRFHAITPVTAVQIEWSIGTRDAEDAGRRAPRLCIGNTHFIASCSHPLRAGTRHRHRRLLPPLPRAADRSHRPVRSARHRQAQHQPQVHRGQLRGKHGRLRGAPCRDGRCVFVFSSAVIAVARAHAAQGSKAALPRSCAWRGCTRRAQMCSPFLVRNPFQDFLRQAKPLPSHCHPRALYSFTTHRTWRPLPSPCRRRRSCSCGAASAFSRDFATLPTRRARPSTLDCESSAR